MSSVFTDGPIESTPQILGAIEQPTIDATSPQSNAQLPSSGSGGVVPPDGNLPPTASSMEVLEASTSETPATVESEVVAPWYESYNDAIKQSKVIKKYESPEKALEALDSLHKLLGKRAEKYTAEEVKSFLSPEELYEQLEHRGMPADISEYKFQRLENQIQPEIAEQIKKVGFEYNIAPDKMENLIQMQANIQHHIREQEMEAWDAQVFNKYGAKYDSEIAWGEKALHALPNSESLVKELRKSGLYRHPVVVDHFIALGKMMAQDGVPPMPNSQVQPSNGDKVQDEIQALYNNPGFMRAWREGDPGAVAQMNDLYAKKFSMK